MTTNEMFVAADISFFYEFFSFPFLSEIRVCIFLSLVGDVRIQESNRCQLYNIQNGASL